MGRLSVTIDTSRFQTRCQTYVQKLNETLETSWEDIVSKCIEDILSRTPDPISEFRYIQGYDGGITFRGTRNRKTAKPGKSHRGPRSFGAKTRQGRLFAPEDQLLGDVNRRTDRSTLRREGARSKKTGAGYRISFIRDPGMWLEELIPDPDNRKVEVGNGKFFIGLGVVPILEEKSRFSWQNYSSRRGVGEVEHTSEYGMWSFFEEGKSGTQQARFGSRDYKLKPYDGEGESYWQTHKFYPRKAMYGAFNSDIFRDAVIEVIRSIQF